MCELVTFARVAVRRALKQAVPHFTKWPIQNRHLCRACLRYGSRPSITSASWAAAMDALDTEVLREALSETEQHIADGKRLIAEHCSLAQQAEGRTAGYAEEARKSLSLMEKSLAVNIAERDRILRELRKLDASRH